MRRGRGRHWRSGERRELLNTAEPDSIGFSESSVDGSGFGDTHFGATDEGRRVRGIGVAIPDESTLTAGLVNYCLKHPAFDPWITELLFDNCSDPGAAVTLSHTEQTRVRDVPSPIQELEMAGIN